MCRLCGSSKETVTHIVSGCQTLAQKEYKWRHDKVCLNLHWALCKKYGLEVNEKWYQHHPEGIVENDDAKIYWDFMIQCDREIEHRKPDIVVVDKRKNVTQIIDVACPRDTNLSGKKMEKLRNYQELKLEISRMWDTKASVVPIIIGALGSILSDLDEKLSSLDIKYSTTVLQKSVLLGTASLLRQVLSI